ncbi:MAG: SUMF1/EgtB/PvdO family nonheme iron enzyme, partial [Myxococcota bacterium]
GDGALTLVTDPPGATVELWTYREQARRLVPVDPIDLGPTPIVARAVPFGSYVAVIRCPGRMDVRYPVWIERGAHWDGVPPGGTEPEPVWLPPEGALGPGEVYVPAGPFRSGGDVVLVAPPVRRWCPAVVVARHPVTLREYLVFLDALVASGRSDEAELRAPQQLAAAGRGAPVCERGPDGRYRLVPDTDGEVWDLDWPVMQVDWWGARAYLEWWAERTGRRWRLPGEYEWEKAARGVDGRIFPWGDRFDPSWACMTDSHAGDRAPARVGGFPVDESPYGVRGVAGNVQQWCLERLDRPADPDPVPEPSEGALDPRALRMVRGGAWALDARYARSAGRARLEAFVRTTTVGFRGAWRP